MSTPHNKRVCQVIKLKSQYIAEYKKIHANTWPSVLSALQKAHITDYSIHHFHHPTLTTTTTKSDPLHLLIATFKYTGSDYDADMKTIAEDPETERWWKITDVMQESFVEGVEGSGRDLPWWLDVPEVFRFEAESS
ncbi:rhamnose mutarotase [Panaeolus papilionaceus]|nr:rhamnose mutarotase [Panaeolus papilionaceus]